MSTTTLLVILGLILMGIIIVQIAKIKDLAESIRGEEESYKENNLTTARLLLLFGAVFLVVGTWTMVAYSDQYLGYGPHSSASIHGEWIDDTVHITFLITYLVFIITQVLLFYFAYKYRERAGFRALFLPVDHKLELIWTGVPAIVMTYLVVNGLVAWNKITADIAPENIIAWEEMKTYDKPEDSGKALEFEAMGVQFAWYLRHAGADGQLGERNFRLIDGSNIFGQNWNDPNNVDDIHINDMVVPVNVPIRVRITSRDVLHNFYVPHMRIKMDAVPGMPTYFMFTPRTTTEEYRTRLGSLDENGNPLYPEWHEPADESEPDGPTKWEAFEFEIACAELCGNGHYSMRKVLKVVTAEEYEEWLNTQEKATKPFYLGNVRGTDADPFKDKETLDIEKRLGMVEEAASDAVEDAVETVEEAVEAVEEAAAEVVE